MKKMLAMLLVFALLLATAPAAFAENPYTDVQNTAWYYTYVDTAYYQGWMNGVDETKFDPNGTMTRAMLVTVLYRAVGAEADGGSLPFTDVPEGKFYSDAVAWAYENGVVNGVSDTEFAPNKNISRQEMITVFYRYSVSMGYDVTFNVEIDDLEAFADSSDVSTWAEDAFIWGVGVGIINGVTSDTLVPKGDATRAQCAKILLTYMDWRSFVTGQMPPTRPENNLYPTPESFGSVLTQEDLDELEQYARDYAYETYGYDGNPYCLPENGAGYFPASKWTITDMETFYSRMRECVDVQYKNDIAAGYSVTLNKEDGSIARTKLNIVIEPLGKDYYRVHTYYGGHADPFHQDYWKEPVEPEPHEHEWYPSHYQFAEDGVTPEYIVWLCRGCDEEQLEEYVPYPSQGETTPHEHEWEFDRYNGAESDSELPKWVVYKCIGCGEEKFEDFATDPEWGLGGQ